MIKPKNLMGVLAVMAAAGVVADLTRREKRDMRKCRLPGCEVMHSHNGGYCCPEHCREHLKIKKG